MSTEIRWVDRRALLYLHDESLREHGGLPGLRDEGLLDSALARPRHLLNYDEDVNLATLAAAYAVGIARNHPFLDGNKRTAFLALDLFCMINGWKVVAAQADVVTTMLRLAANDLTEVELVVWIEAKIVPTGS